MNFTNINLAFILFRLMTSHRGWRVDDLQRTLGISDRTYRKYRLRLQEEFEPLQRDGESLIQEMDFGGAKYLRIADMRESGWSDSDFIARVAAVHFARRLLHFVEGTEIGDAIDAFLHEFENSMRDRKYLLANVLNRTDRMFYEIPDAPKDYSKKGGVVGVLLRAMLNTRRVEVEYDSASLRGSWTGVLEPLTLATHRGALYLIARAANYTDIRMYSVDRFLTAKELDEKFDYPSEVAYRPDRYTAGAFGVWRGEDGEAHDFELIFADKRWLKMFIQERRWHPTQCFEQLADGRLRMSFTVNSDVEVWPWIRGFGDDVEVVLPANADKLRNGGDLRADKK